MTTCTTNITTTGTIVTTNRSRDSTSTDRHTTTDTNTTTFISATTSNICTMTTTIHTTSTTSTTTATATTNCTTVHVFRAGRVHEYLPPLTASVDVLHVLAQIATLLARVLTDATAVRLVGVVHHHMAAKAGCIVTRVWAYKTLHHPGCVMSFNVLTDTP